MAYLAVLFAIVLLWALWGIGRTLHTHSVLLIEISRRLKEANELLEDGGARRAD